MNLFLNSVLFGMLNVVMGDDSSYPYKRPESTDQGNLGISQYQNIALPSFVVYLLIIILFAFMGFIVNKLLFSSNNAVETNKKVSKKRSKKKSKKAE